MSMKNLLTLMSVAICFAAITSEGFSQDGIVYRNNYHHQRHVQRDRHGHVISRHGGGPVHDDWNHVLPRYQSNQSTAYYSANGSYYYAPQQPGGSPQQIQFGSFSHIDDLALQLELLINELCLDLHYNYSHNFEFNETYSETYEILQVAKFIHDAEHEHDRNAIRSKLGGMDSLFHHVEDDVRGWSRHHRRQIGQLGILTKMEYIESILHHLMNDVGVQLTQGIEEAPAPLQGRELAPPPLPIP